MHHGRISCQPPASAWRRTRGGGLHISRKIGHLLYLAHLENFVGAGWATPRPFDRLVTGGDVDHPVAAEHFLRFGERTINHTRVATFKRDARAHRRRVQSVESEQHAGLLQLAVVFHHPFDRSHIGHRAGRGLLVAAGNHQHHESHRVFLGGKWNQTGA